MNKKKIILIAIAGLISFTAASVPTWIIRKKANKARQEAIAQAKTVTKGNLGFPQNTNDPDNTKSESSLFTVAKPQRSITEEQFKNYVFDLREQMDEYKDKLSLLKTREEQLGLIQKTLDEDIKELEDLRVKLASTVVKLKAEREKLESSQLVISEAERINLISIAATYDKMDSASASKIMTNMCMTQSNTANNNGLDDAVKILRYMTDRTKAKVIAEIGNAEPSLAAVISNRLKQTTEKG